MGIFGNLGEVGHRNAVAVTLKDIECGGGGECVAPRGGRFELCVEAGFGVPDTPFIEGNLNALIRSA